MYNQRGKTYCESDVPAPHDLGVKSREIVVHTVHLPHQLPVCEWSLIILYGAIMIFILISIFLQLSTLGLSYADACTYPMNSG